MPFNHVSTGFAAQKLAEQEQLLFLLNENPLPEAGEDLTRFLECLEFMKDFYSMVVRPIAEEALDRTNFSRTIKGSLLPMLDLADSLVRLMKVTTDHAFSTKLNNPGDYQEWL